MPCMDCRLCGPLPPPHRLRRVWDTIQFVRSRSPTVVRWFRWLRWIDVVVFFLLGWFTGDCLLEGSAWYTIGVWSTDIAIVAIVLHFDPPVPGQPFWHVFLRHFLPRTMVPMLGINAAFQYNWNEIVRWIVGAIGAAWLLAVLIRASYIRRQRAVDWLMEQERERWRRALDSGLDMSHGQDLLDFYRKHS